MRLGVSVCVGVSLVVPLQCVHYRRHCQGDFLFLEKWGKHVCGMIDVSNCIIHTLSHLFSSKQINDGKMTVITECICSSLSMSDERSLRLLSRVQHRS